MDPNRLHIAAPCHEDWTSMNGDAQKRLCGQCTKHVHDLSSLTEKQATSLLEDHQGRRLCVRYGVQPDGSVRFRPEAPSKRLRLLKFAAAAATALTMPVAVASPMHTGEPQQSLFDKAWSWIVGEDPVGCAAPEVPEIEEGRMDGPLEVRLMGELPATPPPRVKMGKIKAPVVTHVDPVPLQPSEVLMGDVLVPE